MSSAAAARIGGRSSERSWACRARVAVETTTRPPLEEQASRIAGAR